LSGSHSAAFRSPFDVFALTETASRFAGQFYEQRVVMRSGGMAALVVWLREGRRCA
jgi:hypothetical protein